MSKGVKTALLAAIGAGTAFGAFAVSARLFGSWWRWDNMPTAEEWSALFGLLALGAVLLAWRQLRQVEESNKSLVESNKVTQQANIEAIRPRVIVGFEIDLMVKSSRQAPITGKGRIYIQNIGRTLAHDVSVTVSPEFESLDKFFNPGRKVAHLNDMNSRFKGSEIFKTLAPGRSYDWFLGDAPDIFDPQHGLPQLYEFVIRYRSPLTPEPFEERITIDLQVEAHVAATADPLIRIGKDLEVISKKLEAINVSLL